MAGTSTASKRPGKGRKRTARTRKTLSRNNAPAGRKKPRRQRKPAAGRRPAHREPPAPRPVRVLLGVTGGIAAYKSLELVRLFRKAGWEVRVVMTAAAQKLVGKDSFETLSGNPVAFELFPRKRPKKAVGVEHVESATWADLVLVAPATANIIGKLASGVADDLLSTLLLAVPQQTVKSGRVVLSPAMNFNMWDHPSVKTNIDRLRGLGYFVVEPDTGDLACGDTGAGRLPDPEVLLGICRAALDRSLLPDLSGTIVLVTVGRTEEPIDPVRVITNRSSGRMGIAIARSFRAAGAKVRIVAGPLGVPAPLGMVTTGVQTTQQMHVEVLKNLPDSDLLVMCAAVADYRPKQASRTKRHSKTLRLELERTPDILKSVSRARHSAVVVGFSLDSDPDAAARKLKEKKLDLIVANPVTTPAADTIRPTLVLKGRKPQALPEMTKTEFARRLVIESAELLKARKRHA
ncbi:MAG: bifunctional phosphopantothenoylcysteine decarboxylase/phosphopantothenate--cysteine ligase CoaBC [candidate division WOR-3 bacterium]|nr:MAG: bifunctional phosphopantothenoylcysteine decarboxylase/phosphopantothenate--cysteine ligase CoaBC [candidate division WOR-3 bacterium]